MVESGSSLFYLLHCSAYDRLNTTTFRSFRNIPHGLHQSSGHNHRCCNNFASAYPARIASCWMGMSTGGTIFASAHPARIASRLTSAFVAAESLCLSTSRTDCIRLYQLCYTQPRFASAHPARIASNAEHGTAERPLALPQHIPHGLHQQNRTDAMPQIHAICCELVDSFSDTAKAASALTIFPCSSTVKATYIAIIDSLGRTIDRFFGANRTEKVC